jgi:glycosyltransferase involved in cell wall biosynthesis
MTPGASTSSPERKLSNIVSIGVHTVMVPAGGGSYQWTLNILHALNDHREKFRTIRITVFYLQGHPDIARLRTLFPDFHFESIGTLMRYGSGLVRRLALRFPFLIKSLRPFFPLNHLFESKGIDIVFFPTTVLDSALCTKEHVFFMADIAHVFYPHFPEVSAGGQLRARHVLFTEGLKHASHVVVESERLKLDIERHYNADPKKTSVIYQVLPRVFEAVRTDPERLPNLPARYLFYPAQLWQHKNHKNLLRALKRVHETHPDVHLVLSGSRKVGDESIFNLIQELGLESKVQYLGYVSDAAMATLYRGARALVMPTYFGPTNIPTLEAFHFGCPAIISDLPGVEEQVGAAALRFNPDSEEDMARTILSVLNDATLASSLKSKGRERIQKLSYENYRGQVFDLINGMVTRRQKIAIVLTGTIVPNTTFVAHSNVDQRRLEYLSAIKFYRQFGPVYFLENSVYPLLEDKEFTDLSDVQYRHFKPVGDPAKGKGHLEFAMLDQWISTEKDLPARFIKISGRYRYKNFEAIINQCREETDDCLILDQFRRTQVGLVQLFYATTRAYRDAFLGLHSKCDDREGAWIERLVYRTLLTGRVCVKAFRVEPWLDAISGSTGVQRKDGAAKHAAKSLLRMLNLRFNSRYLYLRG